MQPKFVAAQKMLLKQGNQQTFSEIIVGFIIFSDYSAEVRVAFHNIV